MTGFSEDIREKSRVSNTSTKDSHAESNAAKISRLQMTLSSGTKLGRYEIRSKLDEGRIGKVYLAGYEARPQNIFSLELFEEDERFIAFADHGLHS
jgi:hypothetical protein